MHTKGTELWTMLVGTVLDLSGMTLFSREGLLLLPQSESERLALSDMGTLQLPLGNPGGECMSSELSFDASRRLYRLCLQGSDTGGTFLGFKNLLDGHLPRMRSRRLGFETVYRYGCHAVHAELRGMPFGFGHLRHFTMTMTCRHHNSRCMPLAEEATDDNGGGLVEASITFDRHDRVAHQALVA